MALINTADNIYSGEGPADRVYRGEEKVWEREVGDGSFKFSPYFGLDDGSYIYDFGSPTSGTLVVTYQPEDNGLTFTFPNGFTTGGILTATIYGLIHPVDIDPDAESYPHPYTGRSFYDYEGIFGFGILDQGNIDIPGKTVGMVVQWLLPEGDLDYADGYLSGLLINENPDGVYNDWQPDDPTNPIPIRESPPDGLWYFIISLPTQASAPAGSYFRIVNPRFEYRGGEGGGTYPPSTKGRLAPYDNLRYGSDVRFNFTPPASAPSMTAEYNRKENQIELTWPSFTSTGEQARINWLDAGLGNPMPHPVGGNLVDSYSGITTDGQILQRDPGISRMRLFWDLGGGVSYREHGLWDTNRGEFPHTDDWTVTIPTQPTPGTGTWTMELDFPAGAVTAGSAIFKAPIGNYLPKVDPPASDCSVFDWIGTCTTDNVFPSGGTIGWSTEQKGASAVWDGEQYMIYTVPAGTILSGSLGVHYLPVPNIRAANGAHPSPWSPGNPNTDYCIGWELDLASTLNWAVEIKPSFGDTWKPGSCGVLSSSWNWEPDGGWGSNEQYWSDGSSPPGAPITLTGCRAVSNSVFERSSPGRTRVATKPGQWEFDVLAMALHDDGSSLPGLMDVRNTEPIWIRVRQRWSRKLP